MKKENIIYAFAAVAATGFILFWGIEAQIMELLSSKSYHSFPLNFYPSLPVKMPELGSEYIISIAAQIKFRWLFLCLFGLYLFQFRNLGTQTSLTEKGLTWRVKLFFILQLIFLPDLLTELRFRGSWQALFEPLPQFSFLFPVFPSSYFLQLVGILVFGATSYLVLGKWKVESWLPFAVSVFSILCWTILLGAFFGFGKIDHTYASMYAGMWGMAIFLLVWKDSIADYAFGYRIFQAFIWSCYFFSGLEKVLFSGFNWFSDVHFISLCQLHPTENCRAIVSIPHLGSLILFGGLLFQLLSVLQWRFPRWGYITVVGGILFHLGTWQLFDVGGWESPWIVMLLFLWPDNRKG